MNNEDGADIYCSHLCYDYYPVNLARCHRNVWAINKDMNTEIVRYRKELFKYLRYLISNPKLKNKLVYELINMNEFFIASRGYLNRCNKHQIYYFDSYRTQFDYIFCCREDIKQFVSNAEMLKINAINLWILIYNGYKDPASYLYRIPFPIIQIIIKHYIFFGPKIQNI